MPGKLLFNGNIFTFNIKSPFPTILRILEQDRLSPVNVATAAHRLAKVAKKGLRERSVQQLQAGMGWSWRVDVFDCFCAVLDS